MHHPTTPKRIQAAQARRVTTGRRLAVELDRACKAASDFIRARMECEDDPRAGAPDDGVVLLRGQMRELCGHLQHTLGESPAKAGAR